MARRVRRAVGQGGRQAARGRGGRGAPARAPARAGARSRQRRRRGARSAGLGGDPRARVASGGRRERVGRVRQDGRACRSRSITGPANSGKAEVVMDAVRRHLARGEEPLLVVPTRADVEHYLRELAGERAAIGVRVERFAGLIGEAVRRAGVVRAGARRAGARARCSKCSRTGAAASTGRRRPRARARRADRRAAGAPRHARAADARRSRAGRAVDGGAASRAGWASSTREYRATLRAARARRRRAAGRDAHSTRCASAPRSWGSTPVLFYGFDDLTQLQLDAIETLGRVIDAEVTVSLAYEPGRAAFAGRAAPSRRSRRSRASMRELAPRAEHYAPASRAPLAPSRALAVRAGGAARVAATEPCGCSRAEASAPSSSWSRARSATLLARWRAAPRRSRCSRAAPPAPRADLLEEVFTAAGIPFALQRRRPLRRHGDRQGADRSAALRAGAGRIRRRGAGRSARMAARARAAASSPRSPTRSRSRARRSGCAARRRRRGRCGRSATGRWRRSTAWPRRRRAGSIRLLDRARRGSCTGCSAPRRRARREMLAAHELEDARRSGRGAARARRAARARPDRAASSRPRPRPSSRGCSSGLEFRGGEGPAPRAPSRCSIRSRCARAA